MRILSVDPGEKRIGIAISDPGGIIANPYRVIRHSSRIIDAAEIAEIAREQGVQLIVVGTITNTEGKPVLQSRRATRLANAIKTQIDIPVVFWDESDSTQDARAARIALNTSRRKRSGHLDDLAATVILQSFLDSRNKNINIG